MSIEEIGEVAGSQFSAALEGFSRGYEVELFQLGNFKREFRNNIKDDRTLISIIRKILPRKECDGILLRLQINRQMFNKNYKNKGGISLKDFLNSPKMQEINQELNNIE